MNCPGLIRSELTGEPICPRDAGTIPPEGMTWEDYCQHCRETQERWLELAGDCKREAWHDRD